MGIGGRQQIYIVFWNWKAVQNEIKQAGKRDDNSVQ